MKAKRLILSVDEKNIKTRHIIVAGFNALKQKVKTSNWQNDYYSVFSGVLFSSFLIGKRG